MTLETIAEWFIPGTLTIALVFYLLHIFIARKNMPTKAPKDLPEIAVMDQGKWEEVKEEAIGHPMRETALLFAEHWARLAQDMMRGKEPTQENIDVAYRRAMELVNPSGCQLRTAHKILRENWKFGSLLQ